MPPAGEAVTVGGVLSEMVPEPLGSAILPLASPSSSPRPPSESVRVMMLSPLLLPTSDVRSVHVPPITFQYWELDGTAVGYVSVSVIDEPDGIPVTTNDTKPCGNVIPAGLPDVGRDDSEIAEAVSNEPVLVLRAIVPVPVADWMPVPVST